ncbi:hypothetical protein [Pseudomonas sp. DC1.2]|uniref:hypothetical protein n=1 Tax=Pseudomonas sp. DC1.2 TaxID=3048622 RepID=UPI003A101A84
MQQFHFICGLPRSVFTVPSAHFLQNSRFHADMASPVGALFSRILDQSSASSEFAVGGHYDAHSFWVNDKWADDKVKGTWNLFNVISAPVAIHVAKAVEEVAKACRQAMSIAALANREAAWVSGAITVPVAYVKAA